jgi:hypothetical protein
MLRHDICIKYGRIAADFYLEIANSVASVEWPEKRKKTLHDGFSAGEPGEVDPKLGARGPEIEEAVFRESRRQRIGITLVEAEGVPMQGVRNLISVAGLLC